MLAVVQASMANRADTVPRSMFMAHKLGAGPAAWAGSTPTTANAATIAPVTAKRVTIRVMTGPVPARPT
jgi:hypothetical protein